MVSGFNAASDLVRNDNKTLLILYGLFFDGTRRLFIFVTHS